MKIIVPFNHSQAINPAVTGGKGANLALLYQEKFPVPCGWILTTAAYEQFSSTQQTLSDHVIQAVERELASASQEQRFAVRSSSTLEDLAGSAFAGQHETFLNCSAADVPDAIRKCYLSLWSERAVSYREQRGFDHESAKMAVVVQEMVPSTASGVAFSINPVSGRPDEIVIDANYGLGESVVGGEVGVDHFELEKGALTVRDQRIGEKLSQIVGGELGTCELEVDTAARCVACLDEHQLRQIAELVCRAETHLGFPQDIEWGFYDGQLHLLQSRPVTTIPARWTRDESAERFPAVITPMTWDLVDRGFHESLDFSFELMGFPKFCGKWFASHDHYIYGNQNAVELYLQRRPFTVQNLDELRELAPILKEKFRWVQELPSRWTRDLDDYLVRIGEFSAVRLESLSTPQVWAHVREISAMGANYFRPNIAISITQSVLHRVLAELVALAVGGEHAPSLVRRLTAFCETKTGAINKELFELAGLIRDTPGLDIIELDELRRFPDIASEFDRFLKTHGHREVDFDAYHATWIDAPWLVVENLKMIVNAPSDISPSEKERALKVDMRLAERELMRELPEELQFFFAEMIRLARAYTSLDDLEHYQTTRLTPLLRCGLRELGDRIGTDYLDDPMDVFFAHAEQMDQAIASDTPDGWHALAESIHSEKLSYEIHRAQTPQWNLGEDTECPWPGDGVMQGIAGSAGTVEGVVHQVISAADMPDFPEGAILVARTTNPAWTPLFYSACAVITESGGPLSHGAVTAREMGIPAVMAIRDVCTNLPDGTRVRVDGTHGLVEVLQLPACA